MNYEVIVKKKVLKSIRQLSTWGQKKTALLLADLRDKGPEQMNWQNYKKIGRTKYRCDLRPSLSVCWRYRKKNGSRIEVDYVGNSEKAPYE